MGSQAETGTKRESPGAESHRLAFRLAEVADAKGGGDLLLLDVSGLVSYTDYLLLCTARNERMANAIADEVRLRLKNDSGLLPRGADGAAATGWLVLDYLDCILHIFTAEARDRYQLDDLWRDAPRVGLDDVISGPPAA